MQRLFGVARRQFRRGFQAQKLACALEDGEVRQQDAPRIFPIVTNIEARVGPLPGGLEFVEHWLVGLQRFEHEEGGLGVGGGIGLVGDGEFIPGVGRAQHVL